MLLGLGDVYCKQEQNGYIRNIIQMSSCICKPCMYPVSRDCFSKKHVVGYSNVFVYVHIICHAAAKAIYYIDIYLSS